MSRTASSTADKLAKVPGATRWRRTRPFSFLSGNLSSCGSGLLVVDISRGAADVADVDSQAVDVSGGVVDGETDEPVRVDADDRADEAAAGVDVGGAASRCRQRRSSTGSRRFGVTMIHCRGRTQRHLEFGEQRVGNDEAAVVADGERE